MFTDVQRLVRLDASGATLFGRAFGVDRYEVHPLPEALVFKHPLEHMPHRWCHIPTVLGIKHSLHVEGIKIMEVSERKTSKTCCNCGREDDRSAC